MKATVEIRNARRDRRGISFTFFDAEDTRWRSAHAALTNNECIRGNHLHPDDDELLIVAGPALVRLAEPGEAARDVEIGDDEFARIMIPAGVAHAVQARGAGSILVSLSETEAPETIPATLI